ncbi:DNA-binding transcriptional regulator, MurR/RpiR family, contains HTH and SIS domains [Evansella caseinilytica]|uniref:DNA-binding transcriptional regulator, MurR/RpiR family, contains HTH and SIS domains n=1 Tax=Evansella caseinilytica TaxID=1503961 RepID=A0A1H3PMY8_9BACI|nr:MurR/RpiR family transcriptional regulator [Evansella caseinilytica]SDZ02403.1 DNA-binding transcriptional regulator, MurR/RpiR family, contains HTH and SIS domains [Evansella caseinilytica]
MLESDVYQRIVKNRERMSKSHKKIAGYLIENHETAPFLTASKLAKNVKVGEATVIRFAFFLNYKGYPDLQRHLQEALQRKMTSAEVLVRTTDENERTEHVVSEILSDDIQNLKMTLSQMEPDVFEKAVTAIVEAKRIYIIAYRSAASIGVFLEFYLDLVLQNTEMIRQADGVSEHLLDISEQDLVIGLGFSRYTKRTVEVLKFVKQQRAKTLVITDHLMSPLVPYGDLNIIASTEINSFIDSFSAPMSIASALITALTRSQHKQVEQRLHELEGLWNKFDVFYD